METLINYPYIDKDKFNILDVVRCRTSKVQPYGTFGKLYVNDKYFCDTLEPYDLGFVDDDDPKHIKLHKSMALSCSVKQNRYLAIPTGVYNIDLHVKRATKKKYIPKEYGNCCPAILGINSYSSVFIHVGNFVTDTKGCLLVGEFDDSYSQYRLIHSTQTFQKLLKLLWSFKFPIKIRYTRLY